MLARGVAEGVEHPAACTAIGADGLFVDPTREEAFVRGEWQTLGARVRTIGTYGSLAFLAAAFTDYTVLGPAPVFWGLLSWRLVVLFWGLRLARVGRTPQVDDVRAVATSLLGFEVAIAGAFLLVVIAYGGSADYHSITALTLLFAMYAYVPLLRREMLWIGPSFTVLFALVVWQFLSFDSKYVTIALALFAFANLAGRQVAVTQSRAARLGWLDRCRLRTEANEARRARMRAEQTEDNLNRLFDATPVAMVLTRLTDGQVLRANRAAVALFDPQGRSSGPLPTIEGFYDDLAVRETLLAELRRAGSVQQAEVRLRTTGGSAFDALVSIQPVRYGGDECLVAGVTEITALKAMERQLRLLAYADLLTGIHNRRSFFERAEQAIRNRGPDEAGPCIVLVDLDHFKRINDDHGHPTGDDLLVEFARVVAALLDGSDVFGRLGGEEFAILLPATTMERAVAFAERVRQCVARHVFETPRGALRVTLSLGVADCRATGDSIDAALSRADQAMYRAKQSGRNKTEVACA